MGILQLKDITIGYQNLPIMSNLNLTVNNGELLALLGPSGVGKTTLLKTIAGLTPPLGGSIFIDQQDVSRIPADQRDTVLLFQKPLLFPFLSVFENIGFGLKMRGLASQEISSRTKTVMEFTEISDLGIKKSSELSGGQQQRVALARALVLEPSILLLDEPFSSLDTDLRQKMQTLIRSLQLKTATTMLFVTHDQSEAFSISDRIALLINGAVTQVGTPETLFKYPANTEVAHFFGNPNSLTGKITAGILYVNDFIIPTHLPESDNVQITIRPEDIHLSTTQIPHAVPGIVSTKRFEGALTRLGIQCEQTTLSVLSLSSDFTCSEQIWVSLPPEKIHIIKVL
ncbi:MAG: putative spermidine/putrescine transport system ATP-binding protein [Desulforhopalus sp.]|jgi:putative spermidine/putrescine transport system ATP-binding protein